MIKCCNCGDERYIYFSCGNSHCPICQGDKRQNWQERVEEKLLNIPYCHITFTLPHELNGLCRLQPTAMYNMLFRSAWKTLKKLCAQEKFLGALPGMTAVLHTWGSDLKQHGHVHCLVTFGGFDEKTQRWKWPKNKEKLVKFRPLRNVFRDLFLDALKKWMSAFDHGYHQSYEDLTAAIRNKTWVVNHQPPTVDADLINTYLARYICRIGISDDRLSYDKKAQQVTLEFNNYRKQENGKAAPKAYRYLAPLVAMDMILQHLLPSYFQRSRHYGLHAQPTYKRIEPKLTAAVKRTSDVVLVILRLLKWFLRKAQQKCAQCGFTDFQVIPVEADHDFICPYLSRPKRAPPDRQSAIGPVC